MARPKLDRRLEADQLDPAADGRREVVLGRDRHAAGEREGPVRLDDPERDEQARDRRAVVDATERVGDASQGRGLADGLVGDRRPLDEARDEVALRPDEGRHLGADPDAGGRDRRRVFDLTADAEQVRVVAGQPDDPSLGGAARRDQEVPVRDPAGQRDQRQVAPGELREPTERVDELIAELAPEGTFAHLPGYGSRRYSWKASCSVGRIANPRNPASRAIASKTAGRRIVPVPTEALVGEPARQAADRRCRRRTCAPARRPGP